MVQLRALSTAAHNKAAAWHQQEIRLSHLWLAVLTQPDFIVPIARSHDHACCAQAIIKVDTLKDYIAYARAKCEPELTDDAAQDLVNSYLDMRQQGVSRSTITATPRQLESMVRLSEALARMRLSPTVERHDVAEATRLMKVGCTQCCSACCHGK